MKKAKTGEFVQTIKNNRPSFGISTVSAYHRVYTDSSKTKGENRMLRKIGCVLFAAALLVSLGRTAAAAEQTGSVRITLKSEEGEITLYHAGTPVSGGYRLTQEFGGGLVKEEDVYSPALAQWLAESAGDDGEHRILDADGSAVFTRLEEGLYLLVQTQTQYGCYPIEPFLVALPYEDQWNIEANPKTQWIVTESPNTGQSPLPFLGAAGMLLSGTGLLLCACRRKRR